MTDLDQIDNKAKSSPKDGLAQYLVKLLDVWKKHRANNIEPVWQKCDRNFRGEYDGPPMNAEEDAWRSRAVYPMTEQKVTAAEALLNDSMFMGGELPYHLETSPEPDSPINEELAAQGFNLEDNMKRHRSLIQDELVESKAMDHAKAGVHQCALLGTCCFQTPYVHTVKRNQWTLDPETQQFEKEVFEDITPGMRHIDTYNVFLDPESTGDAQEGVGLFIREWLDRNGMRNMMEEVDSSGEDKYNSKTIQMILDGDVTEQYSELNGSQSPDRNHVEEPIKKYEVFEFAGLIQNKALKQHVKGLKGHPDNYTEVIATVCNEKLLRVIENPYPAKKRPYHVIPWQRISGSPWGRGVAQKLFDVQESASSLLRKYLDNKILSGDVMFKLDRSALLKGINTKVYPGKIWEFNPGTDTDDALQPITVPDTTKGTFEAIGSLLELADNVSGVPRILEGQPGVRNATAFSDNQRIQAASKQMGAVLKNFDQYGWVAIIEALYDFNMEFAEDNTIKGDFRPMATGYASFENRNVKLMNLERKLELGGAYPQVGERMDYTAILRAMAEAEHTKPDEYYYTDEEYKQIQQARAEQAAEANAKALDTEIRLMYEKAAAEKDTRIAAIGAKAEADAMLQEGTNTHDMTKKLIDSETRDADRQSQMLMAAGNNAGKEDSDG